MVYSFLILCIVIAMFIAFRPSEKKEIPPIPYCDFVYNRKELNVKSVKKSSPTKKKTKPIKVKDSMKDEAKAILIELGYTAKEADELLSDISASSVNSYVTKAMNKVKI